MLLFAGRLSRNKGVDKLVRALPELSRKFKDLALVIVGSNWFSQNNITDYVAYVRALAKKLPVPVITTGFVAPDEIQNWFAAADLFVCTSQWQEPLARVHYEAMAAGLPIVTTARGGNPEVIHSGENGLVVENPEDPKDFVAKISQILSDKSLMKKMGERGRELAVSQYQWDRVASEILEVWSQAIQVIPTSDTEQENTEKTSANKVEHKKNKESEYEAKHKKDKKSEPEDKIKYTILDVDGETVRKSIWYSKHYKRSHDNRHTRRRHKRSSHSYSNRRTHRRKKRRGRGDSTSRRRRDS